MDKKGCFYLFVVYEDERVKRVALEEKYIKKEI